MKCSLAGKIYFSRVCRVLWKADPKLLEIPDDKEQTDKLLKLLEESSSLVINENIANEAKFLRKLEPTNYQFATVDIYIARKSTYQTLINILDFILQCKKIGTCSVILLNNSPTEYDTHHRKYNQTVLPLGSQNRYRQEFLYVMDFISLLTQMKNIRQVKFRHLVQKDYDLAKFIDIDIRRQMTETTARLYTYKYVEFYPSIC